MSVYPAGNFARLIEVMPAVQCKLALRDRSLDAAFALSSKCEYLEGGGELLKYSLIELAAKTGQVSF